MYTMFNTSFQVLNMEIPFRRYCTGRGRYLRRIIGACLCMLLVLLIVTQFGQRDSSPIAPIEVVVSSQGLPTEIRIPILQDKVKDREEAGSFINSVFWKLNSTLTKTISAANVHTLDQILGIYGPGNTSSSSGEEFFNLWRPKKGPASDWGDTEDRIIAQLVLSMYKFKDPSIKKKKIQLPDTYRWWNYHPSVFADECPQLADKCEFIDLDESGKSNFSSAVTARDWAHTKEYTFADTVLRFFFILESNYAASATLTRTNDILTSYWRGSGLVTPYGKWIYYDRAVRQRQPEKNYAEGKDSLVAIFVSNCAPANTRRDYVRSLGEHIPVDVYGSCDGNKTCTRSQHLDCVELLRKKYKFYLSFENANCRDYITEKFWEHALKHDVVPVVMGAHPDDYKAVAPENSYIHVEDFKGPTELAKHLLFLNSSDEEYNKYFNWKGTGTFMNAKYFCRVCAMTHYADLVPPPARVAPFQFEDVDNNHLCLPGHRTYWDSRKRYL